MATIVQTGGRFEPLYSDPDYYRTMCGFWWQKWQRTFEKWFSAFDIEYNPLENYDRMEKWHEDTLDRGSENSEHSQTTTVDDDTSYRKGGTDTVNEEGNSAYSKSLSNVEQLSGKDQVDHDYDKDIVTENTVSAYDSSSYSPHDKSQTDETLNSENTDTTYGKKTDVTGSESGEDEDSRETTKTCSENCTGTDDSTTEVEGSQSTDRTNDRDFEHEGRVHGNVGVTTSQAMLQAELDIQAWSIYQHIADLFCKEMLITVY